jgi:RNA recognition motif-containing protein
MSKKLYVGNLNYATTEAALSEMFEAVGDVVSVSVITDRNTGRSKGFAFVEMADDAAAQNAVAQLNGRELDGRTLNVAEARPPKPRDDRGSRGGERRGRRY